MLSAFDALRRRLIAPALATLFFAGTGITIPVQGQDTHIAYQVPAGTVGNQNVGGNALGFDFDLQLDILITRLGVFDSGSDGLATTIVARIYDRDDTSVELGSVEFTPEDPGELVGGSRFKEFELDLPAGFHGSIVAAGFNAVELNGNTFGAIDNPLGLSLDDGGCAILFTGGSRYGADGVSFPATADGGPPNRYAAGTFEFIPQDQFPSHQDGIAYVVPEGTVGNQDLGGTVGLGLDFDVNVPIIVPRLGVFDSMSDGLLTPLTARIYHRETGGELVNLEFTPEDQGDLIDGSRFKALPEPLELPAGFKGSIVVEGYNDLELGGNQSVGPLDGLLMDSGGCAISFRGGGRYGPLGSLPGTGDAGPPNRYAAGTFEFKIDTSPPPPPPEPPSDVTAKAGDGKVDLTWVPSPTGTPAAKFRVFRAGSLAGPFQQVAEVTPAQYTDSPLPNDVVVCYIVRAVAADSSESFDSSITCALPAGPQPAGRTIAYVVPEGTEGNQAAGVALGMDFDVLVDITILRLGVFDDKSNGLSTPISARVFDRDTMQEMALLQFAPDSPGVLIGGSRFKELDQPLDLFEGFHGTMVASGYGSTERNGNLGLGPVTFSTDDGGCAIAFVGNSRFGNDPTLFPDTADGGPAQRYAAGTFEFVLQGAPIPKTPQPPIGVVAEVRGTAIRLSWTPAPPTGCSIPETSYIILRAPVGGAFADIGQSTETNFTDTTAQEGVDYCYVVRSVAGADQSIDSVAACATVLRYIAYVVPPGVVGSDTDGVPVGMDFDIENDIEITRLGAFDSGADGLQSSITISIVDRDTEVAITSLEFTPADPGLLINGSRFKALTPAVALPAGTHASVVAVGYGLDEPTGLNGPGTTNPGPCSIYFTGTGRSEAGAQDLPLQDAAGRTDKYMAGTFEYRPTQVGIPHGAVAYHVPGGTVGNQNADVSLGMDFNVNTAIVVKRLGVFDSGSDGLNLTIAARLYDRETRQIVAELSFSPEDSGDLVEGSRFKALDALLALPAGLPRHHVGLGLRRPRAERQQLERRGGCAVDGRRWRLRDYVRGRRKVRQHRR
jgi:hypothetical protein